MEIQIELLGIDLLVEGHYTEEEEETNVGADFEILAIYLDDQGGTDIIDLLEHHEARIKELVIEKIEG